MKSLILVCIAALALAQECHFENDGKVQLGWTAYKTPAKAGVKGTFLAVDSNIPKQADSVASMLNGSRVFVQLKSADSGNAGRDAKLVQFFFNLLEGQTAHADVASVTGDDTEGVVNVSLLMNGATIAVPMTYRVTEGVLEAEGVIDLADFKALEALKSINTACFELHQGKTWQDVAVRFSLNLNRVCR